MSVKSKKIIYKKIASYALLIVMTIVMIYPLLWLFFGTFKTNAEIFGNSSLFPSSYSLSGYIEGWKGSGQYTFSTFLKNTFVLVIPVVLFTVLSCSIVAYGFARFKFPLKNTLFSIMIATLMLPNTVIIIPRYILFRNLNWLNTYKTFYVPAIFACYPFFIFMMVQFLRGIPLELDESAYIDGCNSISIFFLILVPLLKPALFSAGVFQMIWTWNNFFDTLIYINSIDKYPVSLGLRMTIDTTQAIAWNQILAMALISIVPPILIFFSAQKYFVEGIATTGMKG